MKTVILWVAIHMAATPLFAQFSISGKIHDSESGEPLRGANIVLTGTRFGTSSGSDGRFSITGVSQGVYQFRISYVGYENYTSEIRLEEDITLEIKLEKSPVEIEEIIVEATRVRENSPTAFSTVPAEKLEKENLGKDLPFLLDHTPGVVSFSDAGAGVGYSGLRIRGSDPSRINVTINGIPLNDSESQAVFWVDLPDFASSIQSVQIQRGVGTSTNGSGAFGASINIETSGISQNPTAEINNSYGSFYTRKHTVKLGTGLINERISVNARLSQISSDGYIDRASSLLRSFSLTGSYLGNKSQLKVTIFSGKEITYQAWDGVSEGDLQNNRTFNVTGQISTNNFYDNQVDDYKQDHYQLHYSYIPSSNLEMAVSLHYTKGMGFFEQYRIDDDLADYGLSDITIGNQTLTSTDLVRRRWLDNDFYGTTFSANYSPKSNLKFIFGGSLNQYAGDHFGEIIWARFAGNSTNTGRYYDNSGIKNEVNFYLKPELNISSRLFLFGDIQWRNVSYIVEGIDNDQRTLNTDESFDFINPKFGISYRINPASLVFASYSMGNREPDRNDFIDSEDGAGPKHETLNDWEMGFRYSSPKLKSELNLYTMQYKNQLVLTGELNDVGSPIRRNVDMSRRTGVELSLVWNPFEKLELSGNVAYSVNKISEFDETAPVFDPTFNYVRDTVLTYKDTDIILSPSWVAFGEITGRPFRGFEISFNGKFVSEQFLDNKSDDNRKLDSFLVNNLTLNYASELNLSFLRKIKVTFLVNNIFDVKYEPNGYSYFILFDDGNAVTQDNYNFYYPQAGINYQAGVSLSF